MRAGLVAGCRSRVFSTWALLALCAVLVAGCSYRVKTFFFTGVPVPGAEETQEPVTEEPTRSRRDRNLRRPNFVLQSEEFEHGPFASGDCTLCHLAVNTEGMAQETRVSSASLKLAYPRETICAGCHAEKAPANAAAAGLWPHGPVAAGWCTSCHNPHKSGRRYMLLGASNAEMCGQCHRPQDLRPTPQHAGGPVPECTQCHNPHAGRDKLLLRADYDEQRRYGST